MNPVQRSNGIPSTVVPQTLQHPGGSDDQGCLARGPPLIGHGGTDGGAKPGQAAKKSENLPVCHLTLQDMFAAFFFNSRYAKKFSKNILKAPNYTLEMCFTEMINRRDILPAWTCGTDTDVSK